MSDLSTEILKSTRHHSYYSSDIDEVIERVTDDLEELLRISKNSNDTELHDEVCDILEDNEYDYNDILDFVSSGKQVLTRISILSALSRYTKDDVGRYMTQEELDLFIESHQDDDNFQLRDVAITFRDFVLERNR